MLEGMEGLRRAVVGQAGARRTAVAPAEAAAGRHRAERRGVAVVVTVEEADRTVGAVIRIARTVTFTGS
jgi:hypothetical protein